jgi:hypothetical protein
MAPTLTTSQNVLEQGVWQGPAQITLDDIAQVSNFLISEPTTSWRKNMTEQPYDFPNNYCDTAQVPIQWMRWDPRSTYVDDQNNRFNQRYFKNK